MSTHPPVTVLGLGPMGQAMTHALMQAGNPVTVWNRTASRADGLVTAGARQAPTPSEAVGASEVVILSLTDYRAMWDVLGQATDTLAGRTVVNLSSDTPDTTREAADWTLSHGASFLAGGVMVPAPMVGTDLAYVYYSGDRPAFDTHRETLARLGSPRFLGTDPGLAQLMYQANLDVFLTALAGFAHATALAGTAGITAEEFLPEAVQLFQAVPDMIAPDGAEALGARIDAGDHPGDENSNTMMGATADHIHETSNTVGVDTALPGAVREFFRRAVEEGRGAEGWTSGIDGLRGAGAR